jgi:hypothetical protein
LIAGGGASFSSCCCTAYCMARLCHQLLLATAIDYLQLSAMDVSARTTMKGAAKCDKHCELQNSVNRQELERILCFRDIPESMPASVSMLCYSSSLAIVPAALSSRASGCACSLLGNGALEAFDLQGAIVPPAY